MYAVNRAAWPTATEAVRWTHTARWPFQLFCLEDPVGLIGNPRTGSVEATQWLRVEPVAPRVAFGPMGDEVVRALNSLADRAVGSQQSGADVSLLEWRELSIYLRGVAYGLGRLLAWEAAREVTARSLISSGLSETAYVGLVETTGAAAVIDSLLEDAQLVDRFGLQSVTPL